MKIDTELTRKDFLLLNIFLFPRMKSNWIFLFILILFIAIFSVITNKPDDFGGFFAVTVGSIFGGVIGVVAGFSINLSIMLFNIGKKSGVLGSHQFELLQEGLRESTSVNESLQRWESIVEIKVYGDLLLIRINNYLFHVIPKRSFKNQIEFESFYQEAINLKSAA
jgi:YcxB-like protein